jgi:hypothetical protein
MYKLKLGRNSTLINHTNVQSMGYFNGLLHKEENKGKKENDVRDIAQ